MSREILFRAKRIDSGKWVEGDLIHTPFVGDVKTVIYIDNGYYPHNYEVDPSTVCQYTGLTDRNGAKIFDEDILEGSLDDDYPENVTRVVVKWDMYGYVLDQEDGSDPDPLDESDVDVWTVRGNVFENPELLKG